MRIRLRHLAGSLLLMTATLMAPPAALATAAPSVTRLVIGYSVEHRPIVAYHLGNPKIHRVDVLIGQMHGDEHAGVRLVKALVASVRRGRRHVTGVNLWVIPTMNPDGNAANTRRNAHHVDLNRNWPANWKRLRGQYNSGPHPMSEPENRAVRRFLRSVRAHYVVSLHQPLLGVDSTDGGHVDPAFRRRLARNLGLRSKPLRCWSVCHGNMTRWYTVHHYGVAITVEFGAHPTTSYLTGRAPRGIVAALGGRLAG